MQQPMSAYKARAMAARGRGQGRGTGETSSASRGLNRKRNRSTPSVSDNLDESEDFTGSDQSPQTSRGGRGYGASGRGRGRQARGGSTPKYSRGVEELPGSSPSLRSGRGRGRGDGVRGMVELSRMLSISDGGGSDDDNYDDDDGSRSTPRGGRGKNRGTTRGKSRGRGGVEEGRDYVDGSSSAAEEGQDQSRFVVRRYGATVVLLMAHGAEVSLRGRALVCNIQSSAEICGARFPVRWKFYPLYSPDSHALLSIRSVHRDAPVYSCSEAVRRVFPKIAEADLKEMEELAVRYPEILAFRRLDCSACDFVMKFLPYRNMFVTKSGTEVVRAPLGGARGGRGRGKGRAFESPIEPVELDISEDLNGALKMSQAHEDIASSIATSIALGQRETRTVAVLGPRNSGKSTYCRYLINYFLSASVDGGVAYLECDIGQTEFTPPGSVSLLLISQPLLGPPFTHQLKPISMSFVGLVSPADNPRHYMNCLRHCYKAYETLPHKPRALIVNTMGWIKGLGLSLLVDTLRVTKPTHVLQLEVPGGANKNLPAVTPEYIRQPPHTVATMCIVAPSSDHPASHQCHSIASPVASDHASSQKLTPLDHRNLSLLAYLSRVLIGSCSLDLMAVTPYAIGWADLALHVCHESVSPDMIFYAMNASVVALYRVQPNMMLRQKYADLPRLLKFSPVYDCLGYGLVRGIDVERRCLYILTPVSPDILSRVNCLVKGAVEVPQQLLLQSTHSQSGATVPYVGRPKDVAGASSVKPRRPILRGRSADAARN